MNQALIKLLRSINSNKVRLDTNEDAVERFVDSDDVLTGLVELDGLCDEKCAKWVVHIAYPEVELCENAGTLSLLFLVLSTATNACSHH